MPLENEHACRLRQPGQFKDDSFRRVTREHEGKKYGVIRGRLKSNDEWQDQAFRYPKDTWTESEARGHCKDHDGILFEPASSEANAGTEIEKRYLAVDAAHIELRDAGEGLPELVGYAAVFDSPSEEFGFGEWKWIEQIRRGAFKRSLADGDDVRALVDHDPSRLLGRNKADTLELREDKQGLHVVIQPPDTSVGRDTLELIRRGDLSQMSFAFQVREQIWTEKQDEPSLREIVDAKLFDVSVVTYPAYPDTSIGLRSLRAALEISNAVHLTGIYRRRLARARLTG